MDFSIIRISLVFPTKSACRRPTLGNAVSIEFSGICQCFQLDIDALLYLRLLNMALVDPLIIIVRVAFVNLISTIILALLMNLFFIFYLFSRRTFLYVFSKRKRKQERIVRAKKAMYRKKSTKNYSK